MDEFARLGASVFTCARCAADLEALVEASRHDGLLVAGVCADVSTADGRAKLVRAASAHFGGAP